MLAYGNMFNAKDTPHYIWTVSNMLAYGNEFKNRDKPHYIE